MPGRVAAAALLIVLSAWIFGCRGTANSDATTEQGTNQDAPAIESVWAMHYDNDSNTSQLQAVLIASASVNVSDTVKLSGLFLPGGTDPKAQLMFGQLRSSVDWIHASRQLLAFRYDGNSAHLLSAAEVPIPAGEVAGSIAVVPELKAVYLISYVFGGYFDTPGHLLLFHYDPDGTITGPTDVTPSIDRYSVPTFSDLAYGEKTQLLYGTSYIFAHTQPGPLPAFATVSKDGVPSSFASFKPGGQPAPVLTTANFCLISGGSQPLAYTRDGSFQVSYNSEQNALTVMSITGEGVAGFAARTEQFGTDCSGPVVRGAALDEPHNALYAVLQMLDAKISTPLSAVLARFTFDPMTGAISSAPVQQIPVGATDRIYIPRYGSRIFVLGKSSSLMIYALADERPTNPQTEILAFTPDLLFGDVPKL
ncbi:MAG: hypothetical protein DMG64_05740 [Acidobacteria bacterium]|nr:MAG: hypothetical protein DMG64_05740 [Acidobacteriota bacterium]PYY23886.1 MAG: hypothetical protein DMG62_05370 [Acidobacteriota bacterium]